MAELLGRSAQGDAVEQGARCAGAAQAQVPDAIELVVVQPTAFCNLDCSYCYLPDRDDRQQMSMDTLRRLCERLAESDLLPETLSFVWHAGEPLVPGPAYYDRAFAVIDAQLGEGRGIRHCFQTNATLLSDAWIDLIRRRRVSVGVSLDGPAWLNDRHRKTRSGHGTFERTMAGVRRLRRAGIPFHVIAVLTAAALDHAGEIFDFFLSEGLHEIGFNIEEIEAENARSSLQQADARAAMQAFFARLIALNRAAGQPLKIREVLGLLGGVLTPPGLGRDNQQTQPLRILNVAVDGSLSAFSPELLGASAPGYDDFVFGNVWTHSLADVLAEPKFKRAAREIAAGVARCAATCGYFDLCGGGAPSNKLFECGSFDAAETLYCRLTKKAVADAVMAALESDLRLAEAAAVDERPEEVRP